jgi:hypothetical protein
MKRTVLVCVLAGSLATACRGSSSPTAPAESIGVATPVAASVASLADCLGGSQSASCYSGGRLVAEDVSGALATSPGSPRNLVASASGSSVTLSWVAPNGGDPMTAYVIEAGSAPGLANLAAFSTGNTLTIFHASGIGAGTYYVRVRAANAFGSSAASNEAVLVVGGSPGTAPGAPSGLTSTVNAGGTVGFAWNAASGSPTTYVIEAGYPMTITRR